MTPAPPPSSSSGPPSDPHEDPLWIALDRAAAALERAPSILREKEPNYEAGLNVATINRRVEESGLRSGRVFELEDVVNDGFREKFTRVFSPSGRESVRLLSWSSLYYARPPDVDVAMAVTWLRSWRDDRAVQLLSRGGDWFMLDVLEGRLPSTLIEEPSEQDRVRTLASRLRSAAATRGIAPRTATDAQLARAVRAWLVSESGISDAKTGSSTVSEVISFVRDRQDAEVPSGAVVLDLDQDGRHLLLNGARISYRTKSRGGEMTLNGPCAAFLVRVARGEAAIASAGVLLDVRKGLQRARGGAILLTRDGDKYATSKTIAPTRGLLEVLGMATATRKRRNRDQ